MKFRYLILSLFAVLVAACATAPSPDVARDGDAYSTLEGTAPEEGAFYRIGPFDRLTISVFNEPSLSFSDIPVDARGQFEYPLIGTVEAQGKTPAELTAELKQRLDADYYNDVRVTVFVNASASQYVTVEGSVTEPGRYELPNGRASLLEVIALAKSPTRTAALDEIMVFREVDGTRYGALFNLSDIRKGSAENPDIISGDVVVVGYSGLKGAFRDFLQAAPLFNVFRPF
ncbi:polysaccharide biosynthesis/export family protein [Qipengyuania sphaerica]|uniref:polysaccharide biosynthesis/export family protein n=1 Tax=Qipengyuania sphaerica TaxID=2867243 RepID=UPI001C87E32F|nr:polysaccharide biosynthesis/export family protein [Qipengyuania sphaerica]MBX7540905.1 polysaccharide export protein [Qipengyuania sphaerica]